MNAVFDGQKGGMQGKEYHIGLAKEKK